MKRALAGMCAWILVGCGEPSPLTVVDELRVLAVAVEPASPVAGETPEVVTLIADPAGEGFDRWVWWCVGEDCGTGPVPAGPTVDVWVLACAPGRCEGPGEDLADPSSWMAELPLEGVALARRALPQSPSAEARVNVNPTLALAGEAPAEVGVGSTTALVFDVQDPDADNPAVYGFATAGGFRMVARPVIDGRGTVEFVAPETAGPVDLFVVVEDGLGGAAWWEGRVEVR